MPYDDIAKVLDIRFSGSHEILTKFQERLVEGKFTRDENPQSHYCVYFLPYNPKTHEVFIVHHKKSGLWIAPGGHIDEGETLFQTLNREIDEELGMRDFFSKEQLPFLLTITPIQNAAIPCKAHFDIWFLVKTDGGLFHIDPREFLDTKWLSVEEARKYVTDPPNLRALEVVEQGLE